MRISHLIPVLAILGVLPSSLSFADDMNNQSSATQPSQDQQAATQGKKSPAKEELAHLKTTCQSDIDSLCSDVTPGEGRIASCLNSKEDQLSPGCQKAWMDGKAKLSQKMDKAEVNFRKNCGSDVQKFCSDVPSGRGRLLSCLDSHEGSLSNSCKSFQSKLQQKLSEAIG